MTVSLELYAPVLAGNALIGDQSGLLVPTWRRSNRRIGGHWLGTCEVKAADVGLDWTDDFFADAMLREFRESGGGEETWRGAVVKMEYTRRGDTFIRDVSTMSNAIRSIYTSVAPNLLNNGSGESGAWAAYPGTDTHLTITQDATWVTHGDYSIKIDVTDTTVRGATVQAGITIVAEVGYVLRGSWKVSGGSWRMGLNRTDTGASLVHFSSKGRQGEMTVDVSIPVTNTYAGTADLVITAEASIGTINVDDLVLQLVPIAAQTGWYRDDASIAVHGRKESILLRGGQSNAEANDECQSVLLDQAWPNPTPPSGSQTWLTQTQDDVLRLTVSGYWAMLNWIYTTLHGTRSRSDWVKALAGLAPTYVTPGIIETNSQDYLIDDRGPLLVGDLLRGVAEAGASGGAKYALGVYANRQLHYEHVPQVLTYYRNAGKLLTTNGGEMEPWLARPGWMLWQDMPIRPGSLTSNPQHDPRWIYLEEVEMLPPTPAQPEGSIAFKFS